MITQSNKRLKWRFLALEGDLTHWELDTFLFTPENNVDKYFVKFMIDNHQSVSGLEIKNIEESFQRN